MALGIFSKDSTLTITPSTGSALTFCLESVSLDLSFAESDFDCNSLTTKLSFKGIGSANGSFSCALDDTTDMWTPLTNTAYTFALVFALTNQTAETITFSCAIVPESVEVSVEQKGVPKLSCSFAVSGDITENPV